MKSSKFLVFGTLIVGCKTLQNNPSVVQKKIELESQEAYDEMIRQARVFEDDSIASIASRNIIQGVPGPSYLETKLLGSGESAQLVYPEIACDFMTPEDDDLGGFSPKFKCLYEKANGEIVDLKVKYDLRLDKGTPNDKYNGEVYSETAVTRLLWALGFKADRMFPAVVICKGCPPNPFAYITDKNRHAEIPEFRDQITTFTRTVIEVKTPGDAIIRTRDGKEEYEGFGFDEAEIKLSSDASLAKTQKLERQALRILMGLVQHIDNKAENQRLLCAKDKSENGICSESWLVAQDVGSTLGHGAKPFQDLAGLKIPVISKFQLAEWSKTPVWDTAWDMKREDCQLKVNTFPVAEYLPSVVSRFSTMHNKLVEKAPGQYLLKRLRKLTPEQILDIFKLAMIDKKDDQGEALREARMWRAAFLDKLDQFEENLQYCPGPPLEAY